MISIKNAKTLVTIAALYNASALFVFLTPGGLAFFGVEPPYSTLWTLLPSLLALFGSIVLFLSSRNLVLYASFPYWNGLVRVLFASIAILMDYHHSVGLFIGLIAYGDLLLGLLCVFILPKAMNKSHKQLLINDLNN